MKLKKIPIYILLAIVTFLFIFAVFFGYFLSEFYVKRPPKNAELVFFTIEEGEGANLIGQKLEEAGVINNKLAFKAYVWLFGLQLIFQPGDYTLKVGQNISKLANEMTAIRIKEKTFTIIEGWTLRDLAEYLIKKELIANENELYYLTAHPAVDYRNAKVDFKGGWQYDFLADKPAYVSLEGYIYPDTYRILADGTVDNLLKKALDNFGKKLTPEIRAEIKKQNRTIFEVLTMASIIEREVNSYEDRRIVADIIRRRIKYNMSLQMDSTINYFTNSGRSRSTYDDLSVDSPWNTYKYKGLPLGPINNPSVWSIKAALYPTPNEYLYFLTDKEGRVYYAKTGAEHQANRKYLD
ncbi:MAG: endolytic transglycosylase MltG [Parcubacteria group bacterium CG10_big_fil_rev_8_21_14_0_10_36_14]|nr:MAG: endolytic transglycosylase MltG [Parcubacteria group bacterium CG10_big_fil_rev_8_21_14_0_10_36_14]